MIKAQFESLGVYLPDRVVTTQELIDQMPAKPLFDLEFLTGVKDRRWRSEAQDSYTMAMAAAEDCLKKSGYEADDLDVIICASISHFKSGLNLWMKPDMSKFLKKSLGLRPDAMSFSITNACAGMLTGVHILNNMIRTGAVKTGMVISGECITPISETAIKEIREPIDPQFASLTVGDSGVALIMDRAADENEGIDFIEFMTIADFADLCLAMPSNENTGIGDVCPGCGNTPGSHSAVAENYRIYDEQASLHRPGFRLRDSASDLDPSHSDGDGALLTAPGGAAGDSDQPRQIRQYRFDVALCCFA